MGSDGLVVRVAWLEVREVVHGVATSNFMDFRVSRLFSEQFMPHGHCYFWYPEVLWLNVISDVVIGASYFLIPVALFYFTRRRKDLVFHWIYLLFALFILACGTTHFVEVWNVWNADYGVGGIIKAVTALVSFITALLLLPLIPRALLLPSMAELDTLNKSLAREVEARKHAQNEVIELNRSLQRQIDVRAGDQAAAITDCLPHLLWTCDARGVPTSFNAAWLNVTGSSVDDSISRGWLDFVHQQDRQTCADLWEQALRSQQHFQTQCRLRKKDGSYCSYTLRVVPSLNSKGGVTAWIGTFTD